MIVSKKETLLTSTKGIFHLETGYSYPKFTIMHFYLILLKKPLQKIYSIINSLKSRYSIVTLCFNKEIKIWNKIGINGMVKINFVDLLRHHINKSIKFIILFVIIIYVLLSLTPQKY